MLEVRQTPPNGLNLVSTFSGCGGTCLGYEMAGFNVLWGSEFVPAAREVYALNHPGVILDDRDIRTVTGNDILQTINMRIGDVDVLEGSPPCAAFSVAGRTTETWQRSRRYSDTVQRTDDLFWEFARLVDEIQPKVFVAENVAGLAQGVSKGYFKQIYHALQDCRYRVEARLLDASWLGVPQARRRLFIVGVRNDLDLQPVFPKPWSFQYHVADALPYVRSIKLTGRLAGHKPKARWSLPGRPLSTVCQTDYSDPFGVTAFRSAGGWMQDSAGIRRWTIEELKLLCSFPADFQLLGTYGQQGERLGRAVPPLMAKAMAETVRDLLKNA